MKDPRNKPHPSSEANTDKWMSTAVKHPGYLHRVTNTPLGENIPQAKITQATHSSNPHTRRAANLAETFAHHRP